MVGFAERGDRRRTIGHATEEALAVRGTVVLEAAGDARRWCAVCASVQGDRRSLVVPGVLPGAAAPPGDADYAEHLATALRWLVAAGEGSVHVECGRPGRPLAWIWLDDGALVAEIESRDTPGTDVELGRFPPSPSAAADAACAVTSRLERDFACKQPVPLFIGCLATVSEG